MGTGTEYWSARKVRMLSGGISQQIGTIKNLDANSSITVRFNPAEITFNKSLCYTARPMPRTKGPRLNFGGEKGSRLSMRLLFDTTPTGDDVRERYINFLLALTDVDFNKNPARPPICQFTWGSFSKGEMSFKAYIKDLDVTFTMFLADGTPIRAEATLTFFEFTEEEAAQNPTSRSEARRIWVVTEGETIDWIAYKEYGDAARWRHIAQVNNLADPMRLRAGTVLKLTPLP